MEDGNPAAIARVREFVKIKSQDFRRYSGSFLFL
jgi:hypothetical protein